MSEDLQSGLATVLLKACGFENGIPGGEEKCPHVEQCEHTPETPENYSIASNGLPYRCPWYGTSKCAKLLLKSDRNPAPLTQSTQDTEKV